MVLSPNSELIKALKKCCPPPPFNHINRTSYKQGQRTDRQMTSDRNRTRKESGNESEGVELDKVNFILTLDIYRQTENSLRTDRQTDR